MNPWLAMDVLESAEPATRMSDRESPRDDSPPRRRPRPALREAGGPAPEFYNDEAPHELDELA